MPTPAKLVSAVLFAALCWWTGETIVQEVLPEGSVVGYFREILAACGLYIGWRFIGKPTTGPTGRGAPVTEALTAGLGAGLIYAVLGLLLHSFYEMISRSLDSVYTEVGAAASAWMGFLWDDILLINNPVVLGTFFGGAAAVGVVAGIVGRLAR